jgi:hypothetical protein
MLIGLTGAVGAGKDSAANVLQAAGFQRLAFADALRIEVAEAWSVDLQLLTERRTKEATTPLLAVGGARNARWIEWAVRVRGWSLTLPRSPRWAMQQWADFRRAERQDYWVRHVMHWVEQQRRIAERRGGQPLAVITDVRLPIEAQAIQQAGGYIVRVHRPDLPAMADDTATHNSERHTGLIAAAEIHNDGTLLDLFAEVARVVRLLTDQAEAATASENYGGTA